MMIPEKLVEIMKQDGVVAIATLGKCPAPSHCTTFRVSPPIKYPLFGMTASGAGGL
jgi:hypothetical protein